MMSEKDSENNSNNDADIEQFLYGRRPVSNVVGMDIDGMGTAVLFVRHGDEVEMEVLRHRHFFMLSDEQYAEGIDYCSETVQLDGEEHYRYVLFFPSRAKLWKACNKVIRNYNRIHGTAFKHDEYWRIPDLFLITDPEIQFLLASGVGQFKDMDFSDVRRMQIALAVDTPWEPEYTSPFDERNRLLCIALSDNTGWNCVIDAGEYMEKGMLERLCEAVAERDPDIIEGHGLFHRIFPLLAVKFKQYKLGFRLGRRGYVVEKYSTSRFLDGKRIPFTNYIIQGRHAVDTWMLAAQSGPLFSPDVNERDVYAVAHALTGNDTYLRPQKECSLDSWGGGSEDIIDDARLRAEATSEISRVLLSAEFHQARIVPIPLGKLCMSGQANRIDYLMIRAYLQENRAVPHPHRPEPFEGGYNEIFITGRCENVVKIDVESQYPSIMIGEKIRPASDTLGVFLPILERLTELRLEAKTKRDSAVGSEYHYYDHLQSAFKVLINSFYGYLGYRNAHFADFAAAARVTARGREIMKSIIGVLEDRGCRLIQADTDGCHFLVPSEKASDSGTLNHIRLAVKQALPDYMDVSIEGTWPCMLSIKKKNYALLERDGSVSIIGGILKSRSDEKFVRRALETAARQILTGDLQKLQEYVRSLREEIMNHRLPPADFQLSETITMNRREYLQKVSEGSGRKPIYERMLGYEGERAFLIGDRVFHYNRHDSDRPEDSGVEFAFFHDPDHADEDVHY